MSRPSIRYGVQYYRAPFPRSEHWADDLARIRDSGLNTIQLWLVWGWIESKPGTFRYDDYDRLVELAGQNGLSVVLSTIAAIQPYWIHREVPDSEMITNMGAKVVSTNRRECHFGLTPGGCIDHPGVWERMRAFLRTTAEHFAQAEPVAAWDVWNELRWSVHAEGLVCYCDHTVAAYREWLRTRYGDLDGLNRAWERRYSSWDEVVPGKRPDRTYTDTMAFSHFITDRSVAHADARYQAVKQFNPDKPVTVHGGKPTVLYGTDSYFGEEPNTALHRGNDWGFAQTIDGVGTSSFPAWEEIELTEYLARIDCVASAAFQPGRPARELWLSELQGGRSADGLTSQRAVDAAQQQRWVWAGLASGASTVLFWCWRDEVFGRESGGFGIGGNDGYAEERIAAHQITGRVLDEHGQLLAAYRPDAAAVGIWFSPSCYYLEWSETGSAVKSMQAIQGVARALIRASVPYRIVEEEHLDGLDDLSLVYLPRTLVVDEPAQTALVQYVRRGGILIVESETGAFTSTGLYRYPDERFLAKAFGIIEEGRRPLEADAVEVTLALPIAPGPDAQTVEQTYRLPASAWLTTQVDAPVTASSEVEGAVIALPSFHAETYDLGARAGDPRYVETVCEFERMLLDLCSWAAGEPSLRVAEAVTGAPLAHVRSGRSGDRRLIFVVTEEPERSLTVEIPEQWPSRYRDVLTDRTVQAIPADEALQQLCLAPSAWGVHVLVEDA